MEIKYAPLVWSINQKLIPCTQIEPTKESIEFFNSLVKKFKELKYSKIVRTPRGSFSYSKTVCPAYDVRATKSIIELTIADKNGLARVQFRTVNKTEKEDSLLYGYKAFQTFKNICSEFGIDLSTYYVDNGKEIKETIEKYLITLTKFCVAGKENIYKNAHHIDFHSSFPSGLVNTHPEFRPVIEKLYKGRKINPEYKYILNATIGYFQSIFCFGAKLANLAKDAIADNNQRVMFLLEKLVLNGRIPLSVNTDGIWYTGEIYHGEGEGDDICQWHNDHTNCIIRYKSRGAYEFIEDGKYTPVLRGHSRLDDIKPREQWEWGDIFSIDAAPFKYVVENDLIYLREE